MTVSVTDRPISVAPEWAPQKAIWTAWPANLSQWNGDLEAPRRDVAAMVRALGPANRVRLLVNGAEAEASARAALGGVAEIVPARYGDIWLRDTGPIFARLRGGAVALSFKTNGWGGKYDLPDDATVGEDVARLAGLPVLSFDFVLEGGAVDHDGEGTVLTTRQCLLNPNRNPAGPRKTPRRRWRKALGAKKVIWLDEGPDERPHRRPRRQPRPLRRRRTRGVPVAFGADDPNAETYDASRADAGRRRPTPTAARWR